MKIGFFTDTYHPHIDGVAISVDTCVRALEERGHEVYIIAPKYPKYKDKRKNIHRLMSVKLPKASGFRVALQLPEKAIMEILAIDFDIIHGHPAGSGITFLGLEIARFKNIPYIATCHTFFNRYSHYFFGGRILKPKMMEVLTKIIGNLCDYIIAPTERVKTELISYGIKRPIHVLPSGININNYTNIPRGFLRKKLKLSSRKKILLSIERLGIEKSVDFLIESFALIHSSDPDTVLVLVGDGHEKENLKNLAKELGIDDCVYFAGLVNHKHIPKAYADADVFIFASQTETQGLVILEALASGLPVVAVKDGAFKDVIQNGYNGYLVKKDKDIFSKKILNVISNAKVYGTLSHNARESVEKFSIDKTAEHLEKLYMALIKEKEMQSHKKKLGSISIRQVKRFISQARYQLNNYLEF